MESVKLGLMGCGTVGTGVARLLINGQPLLQRRAGVPLELKYVADLDMDTERDVTIPPGVFIKDAWQIVNDPRIDIVIELIGGQTLAKDLVMAAIENGKHVVTANKALLASHGNQLFAAAADKGVDMAYEAAVCSCIPIIKALRESLVANEISAMCGILNGTSNYILSQITEQRIPFAEALSQAQTNGYAEADPTLDIGGFDAAHKLAILTALAYGMRINYDDIFVEGIESITPLDIQYAGQFGYCIKLLAISKQRGDKVEARVHPTMIPLDHILSSVSGSLNAIMVSGDATGDLFLSGFGAGMMPTASAVVSDVVDLARNIRFNAIGRVPLLTCQWDQIQTIAIRPMAQFETQYYFRFPVLDRPGVLGTIAGILGHHGISIKSVQQKGRKTDGTVPIFMLTHMARETDVQKAMQEISALDIVGTPPVLIRMEADAAAA